MGIYKTTLNIATYLHTRHCSLLRGLYWSILNFPLRWGVEIKKSHHRNFSPPETAHVNVSQNVTRIAEAKWRKPKSVCHLGGLLNEQSSTASDWNTSAKTDRFYKRKYFVTNWKRSSLFENKPLIIWSQRDYPRVGVHKQIRLWNMKRKCFSRHFGTIAACSKIGVYLFSQMYQSWSKHYRVYYLILHHLNRPRKQINGLRVNLGQELSRQCSILNSCQPPLGINSFSLVIFQQDLL